jgi:ketosteroid isomerase-like protein
MDVARAYESAWNTFDAAAVTALFAEPFNTDYGFPMTDKKAWSEGWPYGMARGMGMRIALHDCEINGDTVTCKVASQSPCFAMDVIEALTVQDGKITKLEHRGIPAEDARWEAYSTAVEKWAEQQGIDEWQAYSDEVAKGTYGYDWGAAFVSLCQQYEAAGQAQDPAATIQSWLDGLNKRDLDATLALMTPDAKMTGVFTQPTRNVLKWWIDLNLNYSAPECQPNGDKLTCDFTMTDDGCIAASGNTHGLPLQYTFTMQDGKIQRVLVETVGNDDWNSYGKWLAGEDAWERIYRTEERANIDYAGYSKGGDVALKLCQDYADFLEKQVPVITGSAQDLVNAINDGDADAALALLTDDAEFRVWTDEAAGAEQLRPLFDWLAGKGTQYQIADCAWEDIDLLCSMSVVDGCTTAYGATDGLPGNVRFYPLEDGTLRQVSGALTIGPRKEFQTWLEAEAAWASANRADELAQAEGYSNAAGEMAVQLCQEYAETLK